MTDTADPVAAALSALAAHKEDCAACKDVMPCTRLRELTAAWRRALRECGQARPEIGILRGGLPASSVPPPPPVPTGAVERSKPEEPWWCDCRDRKGPHVHMPNWGAGSRYGICLTALVDTDTGMEIPGSRKAGGG